MGKYPHFNPTKYNLKVKVAEVKSGSHTKFNINYHIVWIPKYRKALLKGKVVTILEEIIRGSCESYGWECLALEIMPDHVHLFLSARPNWCPSKIVNLLKGNTSRQLRLVFPELKSLGYGGRYRNKALWARGYYVGTAGHVSQEQVIRYIMEQEGHHSFNYDIHGGEAKPSPIQRKPQKTLGDFNA